MSWKIETLNAKSIWEAETWCKRRNDEPLRATRFVTYHSGYVIVGKKPNINLRNPDGLDVSGMDDIDSESRFIEEWWEWPAELSDDEIKQLESMAKAQPLELYNQGWDRINRTCTFFGPLKLTKCD